MEILRQLQDLDRRLLGIMRIKEAEPRRLKETEDRVAAAGGAAQGPKHPPRAVPARNQQTGARGQDAPGEDNAPQGTAAQGRHQQGVPGPHQRDSRGGGREGTRRGQGPRDDDRHRAVYQGRERDKGGIDDGKEGSGRASRGGGGGPRGGEEARGGGLPGSARKWRRSSTLRR